MNEKDVVKAIEEMLAIYPQLWSTHNIEGLLLCFDDDCIYEDRTLGVLKKGKKGVEEFAREVFAMQPDFHIDYHDFFATPTRGAAAWTIATTWNGEFHGVDCTGKKVTFSGVTMFEFKGGKIIRNVDCWDIASLLLQLEVLPQNLRKLK